MQTTGLKGRVLLAAFVTQGAHSGDATDANGKKRHAHRFRNGWWTREGGECGGN